MAVLLALIDLRDDETVEPVWRALRARARPRACEDGSERRGPGWRAWAARSLPSEPVPLVDLRGNGHAPVATLLLDRAIGDDDPPDRSRSDWSSPRLFDGTACASIRISADGRRVELTRDVLGQRALVWSRTQAGYAMASGEDILRAHPDVGGELDLAWFAALIAGVSPEDDATAFRAIHVLPAGAETCLVGHAASVRRESLRPDTRATRMHDDEVLECFRNLVDRAVDRSLRGVSRPAISLSGGLDSALVAESVARRWSGKERPVAVTFGFNRWPGIDEQALAREVAETLGFGYHAFAADDLVPMGVGLERPICPDTPYATPYREIKEVAYRMAALSRCDAVLSGNFGDHLYAHPARWVVDAIRHGRFDLLRSAWRVEGPSGLFRDPGVRILARPWRLRWPPPPVGLARLAAPWRQQLADAWRAQIVAQAGWPRPTQAALCLDSAAAYDAHGEDWYAARHGLLCRQPLRDPDLTRFMLSLPAFHSTCGSVGKWLAREALRGRLPDVIVDRPKGSDLTPFAEAADRAEGQRMLAEGAVVRPWIAPLLSADGRHGLDDGDQPWLLASVARWLNATAG